MQRKEAGGRGNEGDVERKGRKGRGGRRGEVKNGRKERKQGTTFLPPVESQLGLSRVLYYLVTKAQKACFVGFFLAS